MIAMVETDELLQAELRAHRAEELKAEFANLLKKINDEFPPNTFGLTRTQRAKAFGIDKALDRLTIAMSLPITIQRRIDHKKRQDEKRAEEERIKEMGAKTLLDLLKVRDEAIRLLLNRGMEFGDDFTVETAIDDANELVFEEEKEKAIQKIKTNGLIPFDGQNCDECDGWDGESRRCDCGNRRVDWEFSGDFREMAIYGVAY